MVTKKKLRLLAISIPIVAIAAWIASYAFVAHSGETVRLRIQGYDPRDLLAGHYLRYTVNFGNPVECINNRNGNSHGSYLWCLCLDQWDGKFAQVSRQ